CVRRRGGGRVVGEERIDENRLPGGGDLERSMPEPGDARGHGCCSFVPSSRWMGSFADSSTERERRRNVASIRRATTLTRSASTRRSRRRRSGGSRGPGSGRSGGYGRGRAGAARSPAGRGRG